MTDNEMDSGFELVLDNRRLIAAFAIFVVICGAFFVIGYTTGKRQGEIAAAGTGAAERLAPPATVDSAASDTPPVKGDEPTSDLEWYQSVSGEEEETAGISPPKASAPATGRAAPVAADTVYCVQLGAFSSRERAEAHAADVRSKGFDSRVEELADDPRGLFAVRVGRFNSKLEASQVQLQLKKKGFEARVQTN
jgi:cell division protein FtsN